MDGRGRMVAEALRYSRAVLDVPALATQALVDGCESRAGPALVGLRKPTSTEVWEEFYRLLAELHHELPSLDEAYDVLVGESVRALAAGEVEPIDGARRIYRLWWSRDPAVDAERWRCARPFVALEDDWADDPSNRPVCEREIVEAARALLPIVRTSKT